MGTVGPGIGGDRDVDPRVGGGATRRGCGVQVERRGEC